VTDKKRYNHLSRFPIFLKDDASYLLGES